MLQLKQGKLRPKGTQEARNLLKERKNDAPSNLLASPSKGTWSSVEKLTIWVIYFAWTMNGVLLSKKITVQKATAFPVEYGNMRVELLSKKANGLASFIKTYAHLQAFEIL